MWQRIGENRSVDYVLHHTSANILTKSRDKPRIKPTNSSLPNGRDTELELHMACSRFSRAPRKILELLQLLFRIFTILSIPFVIVTKLKIKKLKKENQFLRLGCTARREISVARPERDLMM